MQLRKGAKPHLLTAEEEFSSQIAGHTELVDGFVYDVAAQNEPHALAVQQLIRRLVPALASSNRVLRAQSPIIVPDWHARNAPEVDVAIIALKHYDRTPTAADALAFIKQFANATPPNAIYGISGNTTVAIADDPTTKTYLEMFGGIIRFAENTDGNFALSDGGTNVPAKFTPAIVSTITSETCGSQLVLGYLRNIYVSHARSHGCATDAIYVYTHDA